MFTTYGCKMLLSMCLHGSPHADCMQQRLLAFCFSVFPQGVACLQPGLPVVQPQPSFDYAWLYWSLDVASSNLSKTSETASSMDHLSRCHSHRRREYTNGSQHYYISHGMCTQQCGTKHTYCTMQLQQGGTDLPGIVVDAEPVTAGLAQGVPPVQVAAGG